MVKVERDVGQAIGKEAQSALGSVTERPGFDDDLIFALATIRGLALLRISHGVSNKSLAERWLQARKHLVEILS
jgi:hypothetical protein